MNILNKPKCPIWWVRTHLFFVATVTVVLMLTVVSNSIINLEAKGFHVAVSISVVRSIALFFLIINIGMLSITFALRCSRILKYGLVFGSYAVAIVLLLAFFLIIRNAQ